MEWVAISMAILAMLASAVFAISLAAQNLKSSNEIFRVINRHGEFGEQP